MAMVGKLKSLEKPLVAVVRLASAVVMPNLMEVPVPVRFIFVLFTPDFSPNMDYHEVGRSFCTLMSHKVKSFELEHLIANNMIKAKSYLGAACNVTIIF